MKKLWILIIFLMAKCLALAQQSPINAGRINLITSNERFQYINPFDGRDIPVRGERFLNDSTFQDGELKTLIAGYEVNPPGING